MLLQGGFTNVVWAFGGIVAALFLLFWARKRPPAPVLILMAALVVVYAASAAFHGLTFESLVSVSRVTAVLLLLFAFSNLDTDIHETVFVAGFVAAAVGFLALSGVLPWSGAVMNGRLQSVFQYANAAGFFLGISAFLTRVNKKRVAFTPFLEAALILTQSVGALAVYAVGCGLYLLYESRKQPSRPRGSGVGEFICGVGVSIFLAGVVFVILAFAPVPQLGLVPPIVFLAFRKKVQQLIEAISRRKGVFLLGGGIFLLGVLSLFLTRGLLPFATYLERLIHIWDGLRVIAVRPLGIGPGAWQHELFAHQSALYSAAKIHSEYIAVGVDAGFSAVVILCMLVIYWCKYSQRDKRAICVVMVLLSATMDIPFSFLSIVIVAVWLVVLTLPNAKDMPKFIRIVFVIPLALFCVVFFQAAMKNHAAWVAQTDPPAAAAILEGLPIPDTGADLTRMSIYLYMERHDLLDAVFENIPRTTTVAYALLARSLINRELFEEAADAATASIISGPHRMTGHWLMEDVLPHLDEARRSEYQVKIDSLIPQANPLIRFIEPISPR